MPKPSRTRMYRHPGHRSANRRIATVAAVLTVLAALAGLAAWFAGRAEHNGTRRPDVSASASPNQSAPARRTDTGAVPKPPQISEPTAYATAAATMLWSYDTRATTREQQLAGMRAWMTDETTYADFDAITAQVPGPVLWSRMADNAQHATARIDQAYFPSAFKTVLAEDPSALTEAYIYAVTVTGKQSIAWKRGGGGTENRSTTLAVQCRPTSDCALVSIAPRVLP